MQRTVSCFRLFLSQPLLRENGSSSQGWTPGVLLFFQLVHSGSSESKKAWFRDAVDTKFHG